MKLQWYESHELTFLPHRPQVKLESQWCDGAWHYIRFLIEHDPYGGFRLTKFLKSGSHEYAPTNFKTVDAAKAAAARIIKALEERYRQQRIAKRFSPTIKGHRLTNDDEMEFG
jgi:hypothetical protein